MLSFSDLVPLHLKNLGDSECDDLFLGSGVAGPAHEVEDGPHDVLHLLATDVTVAVLKTFPRRRHAQIGPRELSDMISTKALDIFDPLPP